MLNMEILVTFAGKW